MTFHFRTPCASPIQKNSGGGLHGFCSRAGAENIIVTPLESLIELAAGNISPATENFLNKILPADYILCTYRESLLDGKVYWSDQGLRYSHYQQLQPGHRFLCIRQFLFYSVFFLFVNSRLYTMDWWTLRVKKVKVAQTRLPSVGFRS